MNYTFKDIMKKILEYPEECQNFVICESCPFFEDDKCNAYNIIREYNDLEEYFTAKKNYCSEWLEIWDMCENIRLHCSKQKYYENKDYRIYCKDCLLEESLLCSYLCLPIKHDFTSYISSIPREWIDRDIFYICEFIMRNKLYLK